MFYRLVSWRRIRSATLVSARSGDSRRAKCHPGESENHKFFESLVHNAPPFFLFCYADFCRLQRDRDDEVEVLTKN